jgi:hypothetical protein
MNAILIAATTDAIRVEIARLEWQGLGKRCGGLILCQTAHGDTNSNDWVIGC